MFRVCRANHDCLFNTWLIKNNRIDKDILKMCLSQSTVLHIETLIGVFFILFKITYGIAETTQHNNIYYGIAVFAKIIRASLRILF